MPIEIGSGVKYSKISGRYYKEGEEFKRRADSIILSHYPIQVIMVQQTQQQNIR